MGSLPSGHDRDACHCSASWHAMLPLLAAPSQLLRTA